MIPAFAVPPLPILSVNAAVPLLLTIEGLAPKPLRIVGAVADTIGAACVPQAGS